MIVSVRDRATGAELTRYAAATFMDIDGYPQSDFDHVEYVEDLPSETLYGGRRRLTKQEFFDLLGDGAVSFILAAAKIDIEVEKWVKRLDLTAPDPDGTSVDLDDPRTVAGVSSIGAVMIAASVVGVDWTERVLNG
jgi:hypothetical protein